MTYQKIFRLMSLWILLMLAFGLPFAAAQDDPVPTQPSGPIRVTGSEPARLPSGAGGRLTVFGSNFTDSTVVRLVGWGALSATRLSTGVIAADVPGGITPGNYAIEVSDPNGGTVPSPGRLIIVADPHPTPVPVEPTPTLPPPTPVPGQPTLIVRSFRAEPAIVAPGDSVRLVFEVVNQGTRAAQGVSAALEAGGGFIPANGQASVTLPDLPIGGTATASLVAVAGKELDAGPVNVPIVFTYHDFEAVDYVKKSAPSQ